MVFAVYSAFCGTVSIASGPIRPHKHGQHAFKRFRAQNAVKFKAARAIRIDDDGKRDIRRAKLPECAQTAEAQRQIGQLVLRPARAARLCTVSCSSTLTTIKPISSPYCAYAA